MLLLPPDLRQWIPAADIGHFIIEKATMVPLLLSCYRHGIFGSRRIEKATWKDVSARSLCGGKHHPDHDTICTLRVKNEQAKMQRRNHDFRPVPAPGTGKDQLGMTTGHLCL